MPPLIRYVVRQEVELKVTATNPADAIALAARVFSNTKTPEDQINVNGSPREIALEAREDY